MGIDAGEHWRTAEPGWKELEKLPHAEVTVEITFDDDKLHVWSKGGGRITYDSGSGRRLESILIPFDGILNPVYSSNGKHLLCFDSGDIVWFSNGEIQKSESLNGAVQHAVWNEKFERWHIAGWREECVWSMNEMKRSQLDEIPVQIVECADHTYVLMNNGHFVRSTL